MNERQRAVFAHMVELTGESEADWPEMRALLAGCETRVWPAGTHLVRAGEAAPDVFFLHRGLIQLYLLGVEGRLFTKTFHTEGRFTGAHAAAATGHPSTFFIRALEEVEATVLPFSALDRLADADLRLQRLLRRVAEQLFWRKEQREAQLLTLSATERYLQLLREAPSLVARVQQHHLASYLGVTEVSLSRLRARLRQEGLLPASDTSTRSG